MLFRVGRRHIPAFGTTADRLLIAAIRAGASAGTIWAHIRETRAGGFPDSNLLPPLRFWPHLRRGFEPLTGRDRAPSAVTKFLSRLSIASNGEFNLPQGWRDRLVKGYTALTAFNQKPRTGVMIHHIIGLIMRIRPTLKDPFITAPLKPLS